MRVLVESRDGLVRIRGEWVMADPEKIRELLAHWKEAKQLVGEGVTMAQALRLLAGGGLDSLTATSGANDDVEVRANGGNSWKHSRIRRSMRERIGQTDSVSFCVPTRRPVSTIFVVRSRRESVPVSLTIWALARPCRC